MPQTQNVVQKEQSLSVVLTPTIEDNWQKLPQIQFYSQHKQGLEGIHVPTVVARNYIFSLIWRCYGLKRVILDYWGTNIFCLLSYYILSKDKGLQGCKNGYGKIPQEQWCQWDGSAGTMVSAENAIVLSIKVIILRDKILWQDSYYDTFVRGVIR